MEITFPSQIFSGIDQILQFVEKMNQFNSYILIETSETTVNAKSLLGMCVLVGSLKSCAPALLRATGPDAEMVLKELKLYGRLWCKKVQ